MMPGRATDTSGGSPAVNCWVSSACVWSNGTCSIVTVTSGLASWKASITAWKASPSAPVQFDTTRRSPLTAAGAAVMVPAPRAAEATTAAKAAVVRAARWRADNR